MNRRLLAGCVVALTLALIGACACAGFAFVEAGRNDFEKFNLKLGGNMKLLLRLALPLALFLLAGCAAKNYTVHPGAANTFDSQTYDSLIVSHSVIETTKADLAANQFPAAIAGNVKKSLNDLITAYDACDSAYLVYHAAAAAGIATSAQTAAVQSGLTNMGTATNSLAAAKGGN